MIHTDSPDNELQTVLFKIQDHKIVFDYSLVLHSQAIPHTVVMNHEGYFELIVESVFKEEAFAAIHQYIKENDFNKVETANLLFSAAPIALLMIPFLIYFFANFSRGVYSIYSAGRNNISTFSGDFWRPITAQTLHSGYDHLFGNMLFGFLIFNLLHQSIPLGMIAILTTALATLTNCLTVLTVNSASFNSLGFSTNVFAGIGLLAAIEFRKNWGTPQMKGRFKPLLGAFALAGMIGVSPNADVLAHFYGFFIGVVAGLFYSEKWKVSSFSSSIMYTSTAAIYCVAWYFALKLS